MQTAKMKPQAPKHVNKSSTEGSQAPTRHELELSRTVLGFRRMARATDSRCFCPPDTLKDQQCLGVWREGLRSWWFRAYRDIESLGRVLVEKMLDPKPWTLGLRFRFGGSGIGIWLINPSPFPSFCFRKRAPTSSLISPKHSSCSRESRKGTENGNDGVL